VVPHRPETKTKAKSHPATALKYLRWSTAVQGGGCHPKDILDFADHFAGEPLR
jgi:hypothetical protein